MSEPTYRIDVEPYIDSLYSWKATVVRLSDEHAVKVVINKTIEAVVEEARGCVVASERPSEQPFSLLVGDDGQDVEHSVKA